MRRRETVYLFEQSTESEEDTQLERKRNYRFCSSVECEGQVRRWAKKSYDARANRTTKLSSVSRCSCLMEKNPRICFFFSQCHFIRFHNTDDVYSINTNCQTLYFAFLPWDKPRVHGIMHPLTSISLNPLLTTFQRGGEDRRLGVILNWRVDFFQPLILWVLP